MSKHMHEMTSHMHNFESYDEWFTATLFYGRRPGVSYEPITIGKCALPGCWRMAAPWRSEKYCTNHGEK